MFDFDLAAMLELESDKFIFHVSRRESLLIFDFALILSCLLSEK